MLEREPAVARQDERPPRVRKRACGAFVSGIHFPIESSKKRDRAPTILPYRSSDPIRATPTTSATMQTLLQFLFPAIAFAAVLARDDALAPDPQDAPKLLDARRAGLGDPAAIAALGIVQARGTIRFEGFPGEGKWTQILGTKGEARLEANFEGIPPSLRCTNGELYWITGMGGIEFQTGWKAAADVRAFALAHHADWRDVYASAELV